VRSYSPIIHCGARKYAHYSPPVHICHRAKSSIVERGKQHSFALPWFPIYAIASSSPVTRLMSSQECVFGPHPLPRTDAHRFKLFFPHGCQIPARLTAFSPPRKREADEAIIAGWRRGRVRLQCRRTMEKSLRTPHLQRVLLPESSSSLNPLNPPLSSSLLLRGRFRKAGTFLVNFSSVAAHMAIRILGLTHL